MHVSNLAWSSLALAAGLFLPGSVQDKWKPLFDYTNLPPTNEEFWAPLSVAKVEMEQALELAAQGEGAAIKVLKAELKSGDEGPTWQIQMFVAGGETEQPKRVNVQVSSTEPKVLRRLELLALAADEVLAWGVLAKSEVSADIAIHLCKERARGDKVEPAVTDTRMRLIQFLPVTGAPIWQCELMGIEKELPRRYEFQVNANKPNVKQRLMLDRFVGEPLRRGVPTELENGMYLFDFITGDGEVVTLDSKVRVNYRMFLLDETKLHDTWKSQQPETFVLSKAPLKGMTEGMLGMRVGGKRKIAIPYTLAFGENGNEIAPPKAMVVCDVAVEAMVSE